LHNPPNIAGIEAAQEILPDVPHIAVFDTAFHQTMPGNAFLYALPYEWYGMYGVRRYGFHGTSHLYVSRRAAALLNKRPSEVNLITMHIGNGVSITAIRAGTSVDTSMGLTPLEGAVMGTRCGDIDPAIITFMIEKEGFYAEEIDSILNKKSGLLGITGKYMDRRDVEKAATDGDRRAQLAMEIEAYRLKKYIGAYAAALGRVDAVVFTAGAGEMNWKLRERVLEGLDNIGIRFDRKKNEAAVSRAKESEISVDDSTVKILVIPTDEEIVFIEDVVAILEGRYETHTHFTYSFEDPQYKRKSE
jgi:acetate kinase